MLQTFVVTLREGIEIALVMGIILAYLKRVNRPELAKWAWGGFVAALVPSLAGALWLQDLLARFDINEELYEGTIMLVAAAFVSTMLVWMYRTGRQLKARMEGRMETLTRTGAAAWGLAAFTFLTVFREGVELLLFVQGLRSTSESIQQLEGFLLGACIASLFLVAFVRGTVRLDLTRFFQATTIFLGFLVLQLVVGGIHEFSEVGLLPASKAEMAFIGPIVNGTGGHLYLFAGVLLVAILWTVFAPRAAAAAAVAASPANPAEARKVLAGERSERNWRIGLGALGFAGAAFLVGCSLHFAPPVREEAQALAASEGNTLRVPRSPLEDGKLHFYTTPGAAGGIRFLVLKVGDGAYATALDACQICGPEGYYMEEDQVVCRHCGAPILPSSIGATGGCNPISVPAEASGEFLLVRVPELEKACEHIEGK